MASISAEAAMFLQGNFIGHGSRRNDFRSNGSAPSLGEGYWSLDRVTPSAATHFSHATSSRATTALALRSRRIDCSSRLLDRNRCQRKSSGQWRRRHRPSQCAQSIPSVDRTQPSANVCSGNHRHGILLQGTSTTGKCSGGQPCFGLGSDGQLPRATPSRNCDHRGRI